MPREAAVLLDFWSVEVGGTQIPRTKAFAAITEFAYSVGGQTRGQTPGQTPGLTPPYMTEGWYCCAEPGPEQTDLV